MAGWGLVAWGDDNWGGVPPNMALVTGVAASAVLGTTVQPQSVSTSVSGLSASTSVGTATVYILTTWILIDSDQDPNWAPINTTQLPNWAYIQN